MVGKTISHYRILGKLGEGGMGVVYKARDTHLDRFVAIKVLPPEKVADPQRKARFVQEAKAASALNHPNIIHIYDIDRHAGVDFIVMEYVAGKTLDQLIPRSGMRLDAALKCAVQVADALAKAHAAGIIHRDVKPGNVMVDEHGVVKVLDFGLAKLTEAGLSVEDEATRTMRPNTQEGTIVGTVAYMSPEQATGKAVDARSDIFSFGALVYEMLTGRPAFQSDSRVSTLAAVLSREPAPLGMEVPQELSRIVMRSLRKNPDRRYQHLADVKVELEDVKEESDSGSLAAAPVAVRRRNSTHRLVAALAVLVLASAGWFAWQRWHLPAPEPRVVALTSYSGVERYPAFSPDGRQVAFSWDGEKRDNEDIYVRLVGSGAPQPLTTDPAPDISPAWSPDATQIAGEGAAVYVAPALGGGQERRVFSFRPLPDYGPQCLRPVVRWSPDAQWLAVPQLDSAETNAIILVPVGDGQQRKLVSGPVAAGRYYWPTFSPEGDRLAYAACTGEASCDLYLLDLDRNYGSKGQPRRLTRQGALIEGIAFAADSRSLVYAAASDLGSDYYLWRVPLSGVAEPERLELAGAGARNPTVSRTGNRLAYAKEQREFHIWQFQADVPPRPFLASTRAEGSPTYSPDGKKVAFATNRSGKGYELWVANADGTNAMGLTEGDGRNLGSPRWAPRSGRIAFDVQRESGHLDVCVIDAAGGRPHCLTPPDSDEYLPSWSRDGEFIYFTSNRTGRPEIWRIPGGGGEGVQITTSGGFQAAESWDGDTLYYTKASRCCPSAPLYARPLPGGAERQLLGSVNPMSLAVAQDGIYYVSQTRSASPVGFEIRFLDTAAGKDGLLYHMDGAVGLELAVSSDGKTILCGTDSPFADLVLVENFR